MLEQPAPILRKLRGESALIGTGPLSLHKSCRAARSMAGKQKISELQTKFSERDAGGHGRHGVRQAYNCCASCDAFARGAI